MKTFGLILLTIACLYMAGLNLWLLFKDWFNERYQKKDETKDTLQKPRMQKDEIPDIIGKSKTNLRTLQAEVEKQENKPFLEIELEKESIPLSTLLPDQTDIEMQGGQSITTDEFSLMAKSLSGQRISSDDEILVNEVLQKAKGTDLFAQFVKQVKGAEGIANAILKDSATNLDKYLRE